MRFGEEERERAGDATCDAALLAVLEKKWTAVVDDCTALDEYGRY